MPHAVLRRSVLSSAVLALASAGPAGAQTTPPAPDDKPTATLAPVVVRANADASAGGLKAPYAGGQVARGGRVGILGNQDVMDTPFSVTDYTQKLIQDQQAASIADVLQNDPAVRVARGFGNYQQVYIVRGLPVYSDDMSYNGLYGLLPRQYLAAELVERVEVLHGASAFLNGAAPGGSGLGGAVNVVPKRAPNDPLNEVTLGVSSGGQGYVAADVARRFGPDQALGLRLTAVDRDGGTATQHEKERLNLLSLGVDYHTGNLRLSADLGYQDHRLKETQPSVTFAPGVPILGAPNARRDLAQPWTFSNERDTFGTLRAEYDLAQNVTVWGAYGQRHGDESTDLANPTVTDTAGDMTSYRFAGTRNDRIETGEVGVRATFDTGPVSHTLVASAASYHAKTDAPYAFSDFGPNFQGTIVSNLYAPLASLAPPATALIGDTVSDSRTHSIAVADTMAFLQKSLLVTLGLRRQTIKNNPYDESRTTPVAGIVYKVDKTVSVYGSYIQGLVQGDTAPVTSGATPIVNAGQVFAPYQTKQYELGVKVDTGQLGGSFNVFDSRKPVYSVNSNFVFEQTDSQRNRGAELSFYGIALPGLKVLGGASLLNAKVAGKSAIGTPKTQINLGAEYEVPMLHGLAFDGRVVRTSAQFADAANTQSVPAWTRVDVGARYELPVGAQTITVRGRVENLLGRDYWASAGGFPGSGYLTLGAARTFVLSGTVSF